MKHRKLILKFKKTLKNDGRTLTWFRREYLPKIRYNYISFQINGHKESGIDQDIIDAMNEYISDYTARIK